MEIIYTFNNEEEATEVLKKSKRTFSKEPVKFRITHVELNFYTDEMNLYLEVIKEEPNVV